MRYAIKTKMNKMASGGSIHCAHGGPAYCNAGCYEEGGLVEEMHPEKDSMQSEDSEKSVKQSADYEHSMEEPMKDPENIKMAKGGMMHPKHMAKMIMMAKGGMVDSEESWDKGEEMEPKGDYSMSDDESMPLDHATEYDDRLTAEDDESADQLMLKKGGLLDRVMMRKGRA